jgi:hypothetical protein
MPLPFASASPDAFVPFGTVLAMRDRLLRDSHHSAFGRPRHPSGSDIVAVFCLSILPDRTSLVLLDSGLLNPSGLE